MEIKHKLMFKDSLGLTEKVISLKKTQTRRIESTLKFVNNYVDVDLETYVNGYDSENGFYVETRLHGRGMSDFFVKPSLGTGEEVAISMSYKDILNLINEQNANYGNPITEQQYVEYVKFKCGIDDIYRNSGYSNKMFVKADAMLHTLTITNIRLEQFSDISEQDCLAEGIDYCPDIELRPYSFTYNTYPYSKEKVFRFKTPQEAYFSLLQKVNKNIDLNKFCFVYDFEVHPFSLFEKLL